MICPTCGEDCTLYAENVGYGHTETWGIPDNDIDIRWFCSECENELEDYEPDIPDSFDSMYFDSDFH